VNRTAIPLNVVWNGEPVTIDAEETSTPGLLVHHLQPHSDNWRLTHHSGLTFGEFTDPDAAHAVADNLYELTDWTRPAEEISRIGDDVIRKTIEAIVALDGVFITKPYGRADRIAAEVEDEIEAARAKAGGSDGR
jgi:hypothetical protein